MQRTAECTNAAGRTEMQTSLCKDLENKIWSKINWEAKLASWREPTSEHQEQKHEEQQDWQEITKRSPQANTN